MPNAENAVIGEDEAEAPPASQSEAGRRGRRSAARSRASRRAEVPRVETAVLHITSAPAGRGRARPRRASSAARRSTLHFKTGNTYEIVLIKRGYQPATRKVAVHSTKDRKIAVTLKKTPPPKHTLLPPAPMRASALAGRAAARRRSGVVAVVVAGRRRPSVRARRARAGPGGRRRRAARRRAGGDRTARAAGGSAVVREVTLPSIERLVEDADLRRASITKPARDEAFVRDTLATARAYAERVAKGDDPYRTATGELVKAYRADWDGTLQPYALYVPRGYDGRSKNRAAWPLIVALHGAFSDHQHNLRRVFGLDNRPGETDAEASRNQLPLPDVPAFVVSPLGRGELMGYDGLGYDDVMRVIADVRRAYHDRSRAHHADRPVDGRRRRPGRLACATPSCSPRWRRSARSPTSARMVQPADAALYDLARARRAVAARASPRTPRTMQVFIFHGDKDPTVPVEDSRQMVARFEALGWLGKNVHYTEYPGVDHAAWIPRLQGRRAPADAGRASSAIRPRRRTPLSPPPPGEAIPGLAGKSVPRQHPHLYVYGTNGPPEAVAAARALADRAGRLGADGRGQVRGQGATAR